MTVKEKIKNKPIGIITMHKVLNFGSALQAYGLQYAIKELGLVGLGGSGFPTYIKYSNPQNIETILINGVECEPFLT